MRWFILVAIATVAIVTVACSGNNGDDAVLLLKDGNITQEDYRTRVRAMLLEAGAQDFCSGLQGLSDQEIIDVLKTEPEEESGLVGERGFTPVAGQEADSNDNIKAASIVSEECERVASAPSPTTAPQSLQTSPESSNDPEPASEGEISDESLATKCLESLLPFVEARGNDIEERLSSELDAILVAMNAGLITIEQAESRGEAAKFEADALVALLDLETGVATEQCTERPQETFDLLCNVSGSYKLVGYYETLWQDKWCR